MAAMPPMRFERCAPYQNVPPAPRQTDDRGCSLSQTDTAFGKIDERRTSRRSNALAIEPHHFTDQVELRAAVSPATGKVRWLVHDIGIGEQHDRRAARRHTSCNAQSLPDQPGGFESKRITSGLGAEPASAAVPSVELSSIKSTRNGPA